jgi:hypothetical protein
LTLIIYHGMLKPINIENSSGWIRKIEKINDYEKQFQILYKYEKYLNFVQTMNDLWNTT